MVEEQDFKPGEMIYIDISSQKNPSYGGSKNLILIQDSYTKQKLYYSQRQKNIWLKKSPFYWKMKTMKKHIKIIFCDNTGEKKTLEEICAIVFE